MDLSAWKIQFLHQMLCKSVLDFSIQHAAKNGDQAFSVHAWMSALLSVFWCSKTSCACIHDHNWEFTSQFSCRLQEPLQWCWWWQFVHDKMIAGTCPSNCTVTQKTTLCPCHDRILKCHFLKIFLFPHLLASKLPLCEKLNKNWNAHWESWVVSNSGIAQTWRLKLFVRTQCWMWQQQNCTIFLCSCHDKSPVVKKVIQKWGFALHTLLWLAHKIWNHLSPHNSEWKDPCNSNLVRSDTKWLNWQKNCETSQNSVVTEPQQLNAFQKLLTQIEVAQKPPSRTVHWHFQMDFEHQEVSDTKFKLQPMQFDCLNAKAQAMWAKTCASLGNQVCTNGWVFLAKKCPNCIAKIAKPQNLLQACKVCCDRFSLLLCNHTCNFLKVATLPKSECKSCSESKSVKLFASFASWINDWIVPKIEQRWLRKESHKNLSLFLMESMPTLHPLLALKCWNAIVLFDSGQNAMPLWQLTHWFVCLKKLFCAPLKISETSLAHLPQTATQQALCKQKQSVSQKVVRSSLNCACLVKWKPNAAKILEILECSNFPKSDVAIANNIAWNWNMLAFIFWRIQKWILGKTAWPNKAFWLAKRPSASCSWISKPKMTEQWNCSDKQSWLLDCKTVKNKWMICKTRVNPKMPIFPGDWCNCKFLDFNDKLLWSKKQMQCENFCWTNAMTFSALGKAQNVTSVCCMQSASFLKIVCSCQRLIESKYKLFKFWTQIVNFG